MFPGEYYHDGTRETCGCDTCAAWRKSLSGERAASPERPSPPEPSNDPAKVMLDFVTYIPTKLRGQYRAAIDNLVRAGEAQPAEQPSPPADAMPCPFCRGAPLLESVEHGKGSGERDWYYRCRSCACEGPWFKTPGLALRFWNTRAGAARPGAADPPTTKQVANAMQEAWDDFCADAESYPDCFKVTTGADGKPWMTANFSVSNFARYVADGLRGALSSGAAETP